MVMFVLFSFQADFKSGQIDDEYSYNISCEFCSVQAVLSHPAQQHLLPALVRHREAQFVKDPTGATSSTDSNLWSPEWKFIPAGFKAVRSMSTATDEDYQEAMTVIDDSMPQPEFKSLCLRQVILQRYIYSWILAAFTSLCGTTIDKNTGKTIPVFPCAFGQMPKHLLKEMVKLQHDPELRQGNTADKLTQETIREAVSQLNPFWFVHPRSKMAEEITDLCLPFLAAANWDYHSAESCCSMIKLASYIVHAETSEWVTQDSDGKTMPNPDCLVDWIRTKTMEGSPRGHPDNTYVQYICADRDYVLRPDHAIEDGDILSLFFDSSLKSHQVGTKSCTADAVSTMHGAKVMIHEGKSSAAKPYEGQDNLAIVCCEQLPVSGLAIALHSAKDGARVQIMSTKPKVEGDDTTHPPTDPSPAILERTIFQSSPFELSMSAAAKQQIPAAIFPDVQVKLRNDKKVTVDFSALNKQFSELPNVQLKSYARAVFQTIQCLVKVLSATVTMERRDIMSKRQGALWADGLALPHLSTGHGRHAKVAHQPHLIFNDQFQQNLRKANIN